MKSKHTDTAMKTAVDLFSGCGGLTQGLKSAGFNVLLGCEIREEAREAYSMNHPDVKLYTDVRNLTGEIIMNELAIRSGELDLLAACPPCQGFSSMRTKNKAIAIDPRNELIFEVARLVAELRPKTVLIENVPRLLQDDRLSMFKVLLGKEYTFTEGILDAKNYLVPQRRKRMILIGSRFGRVDLPVASKKIITVNDAIGELPEPDSYHKRPLHRIRQQFTDTVLKRIRTVSQNRSELPDDLVLDCHKRYPQGFRDVYGRMDGFQVAPTMTRSSFNPSKGRFIHPTQNRGLTIYEIMLLQGFPRSYKLPKNIGIGKLGSLMGEAFPPPMASAQASVIYQHLDTISESKIKIFIESKI
jgi:DNA (cytosine-5)-methyltransferase 1